jgi:hypothetical protein
MTQLKNNFKAHIYALIAEIGAAERITKAKLSVLSRDMLTYIVDSNDIDSANRLLAVLTPVNYRVAVEYFTHFLPWQTENDKDGKFLRFGKKFIKKRDDIVEWLSVDTNDMWVWADTNIEIKPKQKDFAGMITRAVTQAINGDEKSDTPSLDKSAIISAVFAGGVSLEEMLEAMQVIEAEKDAEAEAERLAGEIEMYGAEAA